MKLYSTTICFVCLLLMPFFMAELVTAEEIYDVNSLMDPNLLPEHSIPGTIEGTGTYFEITDSDYLNVTLISSESIQIRMESIPNMVTIHIEVAEEATSAQISLSGFNPSTTYYKYQDNYHNLEEITSDAEGICVYIQDLSEPHLVFIQPTKSTIYLSNTGWSHSSGIDPGIGTWDPITLTGTLTTNVFETIQIESDNITLDGNGYTVEGLGGGFGILLNGRTGVTIQNVNVSGFSFGIALVYSSGNTLIGNTASNNIYGFYDSNGHGNNTLIGNTASSNHYAGIQLHTCEEDIISDNYLSDNDYYGISLYHSLYNTLTGNDSNYNTYAGIYMRYSHYNTVSNNIVSNTVNHHGIHIRESGQNTVKGNNSFLNRYIGIYLESAGYNELTDNAVFNNGLHGIYLYGYNSRSNILASNTVNSNLNGIYLNNCDSCKIIGNVAHDNTVCGIGIEYSDETILTDNSVSNNQRGIYVNNSDLNTLTNNIAELNQSYGIWLINSSYNDLLYNTTSNSPGYGIYVKATGYNLSQENGLRGNAVNSNNFGIYIESSREDLLLDNFVNGNTIGISHDATYLSTAGRNIVLNNTKGFVLEGQSSFVTYNTISDNTYGINVYGTASIIRNNFINNDTQVDATRGTWWLSSPYYGNFWSDWTSPDVDGDGIVDLKYNVNTNLNLYDFYPWTTENGWTSPPDSNAGEDIQITSAEQTYTILQGWASDPDGDGLIYSWFENGKLLLDWTQCDTEGAAPLDLATLPSFVGGDHTLTLKVCDGMVIRSDEMVLTIIPSSSPVATIIAPVSGSIHALADSIVLEGNIDDPDIGDTHTAIWTISNENWTEDLVFEGTVDGTSISDALYCPEAGIYTISLTVTDSKGASDTTSTVNNQEDMPAYVVIYDPDGGFVTGGGWIWSPTGAYLADATLEGKANFGFVSKYKKGATVPIGSTEFQFKAGDLNFHSSEYEWLVVTGGNKAKFKGTGTINGLREYRFMLWAGDNDTDTFRIRIWTEDEAGIEIDLYDNGDENQAIGGGSIVVHNSN